MVDKALLMDLAALNQGIEGRVLANLRFSELASSDLEIKECEVTTIQMPNQVAGAEDDRPTVLMHSIPETAAGSPATRLR